MAITLLCGAKIIRSSINQAKGMKRRQLGMTYDISKFPQPHKALHVVGPAMSPSGGNLGISLNTGIINAPWHVLDIKNHTPYKPSIVSSRTCISNGWSGCGDNGGGGDDDGISSVKGDRDIKWIQIISDHNSEYAIFAVLFSVKKDDIITLSGSCRTTADSMRFIQSHATGGGWTNASETIANATIVDTIIDSTMIKGDSVKHARDIHYIFPVLSGLHIIGLEVRITSNEYPAIWFYGSLSGTLASNIMAL